MKTNNLYLDFEVGVKPPPLIRRRISKYTPIDEKVLALDMNGDGYSEWCRFKLSDKQKVRRITLHLGKWNRAAKDFKIQTHSQPVGDSDGTYWLYVRRVAATVKDQ